MCMQGPTALTQDFEYVAWRMSLLGFNTVRLPFSFQARLPARMPVSPPLPQKLCVSFPHSHACTPGITPWSQACRATVLLIMPNSIPSNKVKAF